MIKKADAIAELDTLTGRIQELNDRVFPVARANAGLEVLTGRWDHDPEIARFFAPPWPPGNSVEYHLKITNCYLARLDFLLSKALPAASQAGA